MNNVAIAFSTKDRFELSYKSVRPLLKGKFDLFWIDGSKTAKAREFALAHANVDVTTGVSGGSGAAIVFALSQMLNHSNNYAYVGLVENDVLLPKNWFEPTLDLFNKGKADGLTVGAVSSRCYEDRVLIQRDGYAVVHNLGAGQVIFSREAARLVLDTYRTQWTTENRTTFVQLSCIDIGRYWAFRGSEHWLCADWRWDAVLAAHGYASLALTPSRVEMIGQVPPLEQQGLKLVTKELDEFRDDNVFDFYQKRLAEVRCGARQIKTSRLFQRDAMGGEMIFAHQIHALGGSYAGEWKLRDSIGFGPFGWTAMDVEHTRITIPVLGPVAMFVSGGEVGGQVEVSDKGSGFIARPQLPPEGPDGKVVPIAIPVNIAYRDVTIKPLTTGITFYGVRCRDEQPRLSNFHFDHSMLPKP